MALFIPDENVCRPGMRRGELVQLKAADDRVTDFGWYPRWLSDGRRLLFHNVLDGKIYLVDSRSRKVHEVLSVSPNEVGFIFAISADDRWIYFTQTVVESDIWLAHLE